RPAAEPLPVEIRPGAGLLCELLTAAFAGLGVGLEKRFRLVALLAKPTHQPRVDLDHRDLPAYDSKRLTFSCTPAANSAPPQLQSSSGSADVQIRHHVGCTSRGSSSTVVHVSLMSPPRSGRPS